MNIFESRMENYSIERKTISYNDDGYTREKAHMVCGKDADGNSLKYITFECPEMKKGTDDRMEYSKRVYFINDKKTGYDIRTFDPSEYSFEQTNVSADGNTVTGTVSFKSGHAVKIDNFIDSFDDGYIQYSEERNQNGKIIKTYSNLIAESNDEYYDVITYYNTESEISRQIIATKDNEHIMDISISENHDSYIVKETNYYTDNSGGNGSIYETIENETTFNLVDGEVSKSVYICTHSEEGTNENDEKYESKYVYKKVEYDVKNKKLIVEYYPNNPDCEYHSLKEYNGIDEYYSHYSNTQDERVRLLDVKNISELSFELSFADIYKVINQNHLEVISTSFDENGQFVQKVTEKHKAEMTNDTFIYSHDVLNDQNGEFDNYTVVEYLGEEDGNGYVPILKTETYQNGKFIDIDIDEDRYNSNSEKELEELSEQ